MSVCRFYWDGSEVYVYASWRGMECCGCILGGSPVFDTEDQMREHLMEHIRAGHCVPGYAFEALGDGSVPDGASTDYWDDDELTRRGHKHIADLRRHIRSERDP